MRVRDECGEGTGEDRGANLATNSAGIAAGLCANCALWLWSRRFLGHWARMNWGNSRQREVCQDVSHKKKKKTKSGLDSTEEEKSGGG